MQTQTVEPRVMPPLVEPEARPIALPQADGFLAVVERLTEKGITPEALNQFLEMKAKADARMAETAFNAALARLQAKMPTIVKDKANKHTQSRYPDLATVIRESRPVMAEEGFHLSYGTEQSPLPAYMRITAQLSHELGHSRHYHCDLPIDGTGSQGNKSNMNAVQAHGSTMSYGRRYLVVLIFNIAIADEDDDAQGLLQTVAPEQVGQINGELERTGVKLPAFLKWLSIESLDRLAQRDFPKAIDYLRRKPSVKGGAA